MKEEDAPNLSTKNVLNMPVNDAEPILIKATNQYSKCFMGWGAGVGTFFKTPLPPEISYAIKRIGITYDYDTIIPNDPSVLIAEGFHAIAPFQMTTYC